LFIVEFKPNASHGSTHTTGQQKAPLQLVEHPELGANRLTHQPQESLDVEVRPVDSAMDFSYKSKNENRNVQISALDLNRSRE
jgi:hypothetical protein